MIVEINKPIIKHEVKWSLPSKEQYQNTDRILSINDIVEVLVPSIKPNKKLLSSLRGKMTKQNEKEIDEQILNLRNEWE